MDENIYIGYTKNLKSRLRNHKDKSKQRPNRVVYKYVSENGGWDNFELIVLCNCDNTNKRILEQHFIDELNPTLNMHRSISLPPKERRKIYYDKNIVRERKRALERYHARKNTGN